ncbi:MAG: DUF4235 domain-containing protein [Bifidobacteriaceae bacterium]|nr:DUF4235 domain-containing protein [Bifidobacteriaceae bacterium]
MSKRLSVAVAAATAGFVASHLIKSAWWAVSGRKAPERADDMNLPTAQVTVFAALAAAATAIAQTLATRKVLASGHDRAS